MSPRALVRYAVASVVVAISMALGPSAVAETITQPDLHLTFVAPEHFDPIDPPNKNGLFAFRTTLPDETTIVVSTDKMGGTIGRSRYAAKDLTPSKFSLPAEAKISLEEATWKSFALDTLRVVLPKDGEHVIAFVSQIPLPQKPFRSR